MKRPAIGDVPTSISINERIFLQAVKERLEIIGGDIGTPITTLPATAELADVVNTVNSLINLLQER